MPRNQVCDGCNEPAKAGQTLRECGQCRLRFYCSKDCQATDWNRGHKQQCVSVKQEALERVYEEFSKSNTAAKKAESALDEEVKEFEAFLNKHKPTTDDCKCMNGEQLWYARAARECRCAYSRCSNYIGRRQQQFSFSLFTMKDAPCKQSHAIPLQFCSLVCVEYQRAIDQLVGTFNLNIPKQLEPPPPPATMNSATNSDYKK